LGVQIPPGLPKKNKNRLRNNMLNKIKEFLNEVKIETKKVVFPTKDELIGSTWVVIITIIIISLFLGIVDLTLIKLVGIALR
jgi:preprotein translocase subunit SecE